MNKQQKNETKQRIKKAFKALDRIILRAERIAYSEAEKEKKRKEVD